MQKIKFFSAVLGAVCVIWAASIYLGPQAKMMANNRELGLRLPVENSSVLRLTEGGSCSHFGRLGLSKYVLEEQQRLGVSQFFLLHGDSFVEAFQVPDAYKPDAALTRHLDGRAVAFGVGSSGYGFPSMLVRAKEYERVMGPPIAHVFLAANGFRDDLYGDHEPEWEKTDEGYEKKVSLLSERDVWLRGLCNRLFLNFLLWRPTPKASLPKVNVEGNKPETHVNIRDDIKFVIRDMKGLRAPSVIVYCPRVPRIERGRVVFGALDVEDADLVSQIAQSAGVDFLDARPAVRKLYDEKHLLTHGFCNTNGPGRGHMNRDGIEAVFAFVATWLKEHYAF